MKRIVLLAALLAGCNDTTDVAPTQLNLDRPVDIAFACYGTLQLSDGTTTTTSQPMSLCDFRSGPLDTNGNPPVPPGQEMVAGGPSDVNYYALILQSAPGTVGIATWPTKPAQKMSGGIGTGDVKMLDTSIATPGKNGITVGDFPIAIATDRTGCYAVTANAGSCDLSALQIDSALDLGGNYRVDKLPVKNAAGQLIHAKPAAMAAEPEPPMLPMTGSECPMQPTGMLYVAYPGCHVVAAIDSATGMAVAAIDYSRGAPVVRDGNFTCPDECGGDAIDNSLPRPVALSLESDARVGTRRLAIAVDNRPDVAVVNLDTTYLPVATPQVITLDTSNIPAGKPFGTTGIALTPQIGMGGALGTINDNGNLNQFQFVYAIATDNTIRVADVLNVNRECDTQIDPRYLHDEKRVSVLSCLPLGDPTLPRRAGAKGPGIELIGDAIPTSVAVLRVDVPANDNRTAPPDPSTLIGYFAAVTVANGATYLVNIDDDAFEDFVSGPNPQSPSTNVLESAIPFDLPHQLRDAGVSRGAIAQAQGPDMMEHPTCDDLGPDPDATGGVQGGPRAPSLPELTVPAAYISAPKLNELPSIRQLLCVGSDEPNGKPVSELMFAAPIDVRENEFPDIRVLRSDENWSLTWQGLLSQDSVSEAIDGPPIRTGTLSVDGFGLHLVDQTRPFCDAGVELYDIVQLRGCDPTNGNFDCPIGYTCYVHPDSTVKNLGSCMASDEADRLADACKEFLTSLRRYTVGKATTGELLLLPRKHVLRTTPVSGCTDDMECQKLATYADTNSDSVNPLDEMPTPDTHTYSCAVDPDRGPSTIKQCIETCQQDSDCVAGYVCQGGYCMEGVTPPQSCVNATQRYDLRAHDAFTVVGSVSGYIHPIIADGSGNCIRDPKASPYEVGRVPLSAPACDPTADPRTGRKPDGTFDANPCETTVMESELDPAYQPGTCNLATPATQLVNRNATALRFRNPGLTLTIVDPTYPGDGMCIGDRMGMLAPLGDIPLVDDLFQIVFRQAGGFQVRTLAITPSFPVKVVQGPLSSIWVVDDGDTLASALQFSSTKGQVFRVESVALGTVNTLQ